MVPSQRGPGTSVPVSSIWNLYAPSHFSVSNSYARIAMFRLLNRSLAHGRHRFHPRRNRLLRAERVLRPNLRGAVTMSLDYGLGAFVTLLLFAFRADEEIDIPAAVVAQLDRTYKPEAAV